MIAPAHRLSLLLALGVAAAAFAGWSAVGRGPATVPAAVPPATSEPPAIERHLGPLAEYGETAARPLFAESRRPAAPEAAPAPRRPSLRLEGVMVIGAAKHAVLKDTAGNRRFRVGEGDEAAGWTVRRIERDRVLLVSPEGELTLETGGPAK